SGLCRTQVNNLRYSEHSVFVRRVFRRFDADVPQLSDVIAFKAKEVNDGDLRRFWRMPDSRVNCNQIAILQDVLDLECSVGKLFMRCRHSGLERSSVTSEVRIVMAKVRTDVIGVGLV